MVSVACRILRGVVASPRAALAAGLMLGLLVALAAACGGGGGSQAPAARLSLDGDSFDLGEIRSGEAAQRLVEFRNEGDAPLTVAIVKVRPAPDTACGCGSRPSPWMSRGWHPGRRGIWSSASRCRTARVK